MIEIRNLSLSLKKTEVLRNVNLTLKEGEITILIGPNGSGKTSIVRILSSLHTDYYGSVRFDGKELSSCKWSERKNLSALLPQFPPALDATLLELMSLTDSSSLFHRESEAERQANLKKLDSLSASHLADKKLSEMSGGERQLSFLALMASHDAGLYLLDEPESNLDVRFSKTVEDTMKRLKAEGKAVLAVFHDLNRALEMADRIIVLDKGSVCFEGNGEALLSSGIPEKVFGLKILKLKDENGQNYTLLK
jgi:ABC-type cobalamin/Fe3+-siderophores transport systems, ATPase components